MEYLLGIDAGSTVTKTVLFDISGNQVAQASQLVEVSQPEPGFVERDQETLLEAIILATKTTLKQVPQQVRLSISGISVTSHGDGLYFTDSLGRPTRPGIMSFDTRASGIVNRWREKGVLDRAFEISGQRAWPSSPAAILAWMSENEPEVLERSCWALPAKDAIKAQLTGVFSTDLTEASLAFTDYRTQQYSDELMEVYGLSKWKDLIPRATLSTEIIGLIKPAIARELSLATNVRAVAGAHDVDCSAIGSGVSTPGIISVVAGSFSINQTISNAPEINRNWYARNFIHQGTWMNMSISPTSSANFDWLRKILGVDDLDSIQLEIDSVSEDPSELIFTPLLFGSPFDRHIPSSITGLRSWHTRGHILRAAMEGVAMMHRVHIDYLRSTFESREIRLTGGASNNPLWCQIFADVLNLPVTTTKSTESGALGAALLAGVGVGVYPDVQSAIQQTVHIDRTYIPQPVRVKALQTLYQQFLVHTQSDLFDSPGNSQAH